MDIEIDRSFMKYAGIVSCLQCLGQNLSYQVMCVYFPFFFFLEIHMDSPSYRQSVVLATLAPPIFFYTVLP